MENKSSGLVFEIHRVKNNYIIADCGGWIDGYFASPAAAFKAFEYLENDGSWELYSDLCEKLNRKEDRAITEDDLKALEESKQ